MSRKHIVLSREMNLQYLNCNEQTVFKGDVYSNVTKVVQTYALVGVGNEEHVTYP